MRTTTTGQDVVLAKNHRRVSIRAFVDRGGGDWVNLSDLEGRDWIQSAQWGDSQDASVQTLQLGLHQRVEDLSLAPLVDGSKLNDAGTLIDLGNPIYLEVAVTPEDDAPLPADWVEVFRGEIDAIDWQASPMSVRCRDNSGQLDRFIEFQRRIPASRDFAPVEEVIQEILDNEFGTGAGRVVLYSTNGTLATPFAAADSPEWFVPAYIQKKQPVLQAIRVLSDQIGWYVRQVWNDSVGAFVLTLYEPPRAKAARGTLSAFGVVSVGETFSLNGTTHTAVASSPGLNQWVPTGVAVDDAAAIVDLLKFNSSQSANIASAWIVPPRPAVGSLTFTGNPSVGQTLTVGTVTLTCVAGTPGTNQFQQGASKEDTAAYLATAIGLWTGANGDRVIDGAGGVFVRVEWGVAGTAGNFITFTEAMGGVTADGAGTLGGTQVGWEAAVQVEWGTKGAAGNSITFTEAMSLWLSDGGGTLGGTRAGADVAGSVYTFGPDRYYAPTRLALARSGIRNVVRVKFGVSQLDRTTVEVNDPGSITKYGRRYMEVAEAGSSQIDTEAEGRYMAQAILDDLSQPDVDLGIPVPFFWPVELVGDVFTFEANGFHFDTDQELAVVSYRHNLTAQQSRTELTLRGKPSGGFKRWLELDARAGIAGQNQFYQHDSAEGVSSTPGVGLIVVQYDDPRGMSPPINDWAFTRVHLSETPGFTADASNQVAVGRTTRFEIGGLTPGQTYYLKIAIIDSAGVVASLTSQITQATQQVAAYHVNPDDLRRNMILNGDFGQATLDVATTPPDGWTQTTGAWGTDCLADGTTQETGTRSIKWAASGAGRLLSDFIPVSIGQLYRLELNWQSVNPLSARLGVLVEGYTAAKSFITTTTGVVVSTGIGASTWDKVSGFFYPDAISSACRYVRIRVFNITNSVDAFADYLLMTRAFHQFRGYRASAQIVATGTVTNVNHSSRDYEDGGINIGGTIYGHDAGGSGGSPFRCLTPGKYYAYASVALASVPAGTTIETGFQLNGSQTNTSTVLKVGSTGDHQIMAATIVDMVKGDVLNHYVWHDRGSNLSTIGGLLRTNFQVGPVEGSG